MKINDVSRLEIDGDVALVIINSPPVNALSATVRQGIAAGLERALADPGVAAVILMCGGRTFFAGADITEFGKPPVAPGIRDLQAMIEGAAKPVIAAIHGTALGGGLEVALAAHYRVATHTAKCGLPEVNLGLLPGAGGTQRLPRLVGVEAALEMVTSGQHIPALKAQQLGLLDALTPVDDLRIGALVFARMVVAENKPLPLVRNMDGKIAACREKPEIFAAFRKANERKFRGFQAPEYNIRCIEAAVNLPFDEGIREERRLFEELLAGPQSAAQRYAFFAERQVAKVPDIGADIAPRSVAKVGVIGAGTMGGGIAMAFLNAGLPVTLVEMKEEALAHGTGVIRRNYEATAAKGKLTTADVEKRMGLLTGSLSLSDLADCDLVIEAVFEQMDIKREVFAKLDAVAKPGAILATNTSYLDIDAIAGVTGRPQDVVGLHFFSPAHVMRLLEIVRGEATAKDVVATAMAIARKIGKTGVVVGNCFGFVGNRMLAQRSREADKLVLEGALPWDVDRVIHDFGFPMGPFQMRDLAGMDIGWDRARSSSSTVREILNEMGRLGQKAGAGYYDYDEKRNGTPSPLAEKVILDFAAAKGHRRRAVSDQEILERCLYSMVNEGAKILEEGKAARASDIDTIWVTGYGWPVYRGGPMFWAAQQGLPHVLERIRALHAAHGDDFRPAPLLERLAATGHGWDGPA